MRSADKTKKKIQPHTLFGGECLQKRFLFCKINVWLHSGSGGNIVTGDGGLARHMVKGHLKMPNRTLPCDSVHQEMRPSTFDHPQSHETYLEHNPCASP